jgi:hypothetical protein
MVAVHEPQTVGQVGVADQQVGAVGDQELVVVGAATDADGGEVRKVVAAAPTAGDEMVRLEAVAAGTARDAAVPVP